MVFGKQLLVLGLLCMLRKGVSQCEMGFSSHGRTCVDENECEEPLKNCGKHTACFNTNGSYYCQCLTGFREVKGLVNFTGLTGQCRDHNECTDTSSANICGNSGSCLNLLGSFKCNCHFGYINESSSQQSCIDINECNEAKMKGEELCGINGTCRNTNGSYWCECPKGYTNYGKESIPCSELDCESFNTDSSPAPSLRGLANILSMMRTNCLSLSNPKVSVEVKNDGEALLEKLFTVTQTILSPGPLGSSDDVSGVLSTVEKAIKLIGPQLKNNRTKLETLETDIEVAVKRGRTRPTGPVHLTTETATLDTDWTTAAGTGSYPGFALAALLSYKNLEISFNWSSVELTGHVKDGVGPTFQVSSHVASVMVSNPSTNHLSHSVNITHRHLKDTEESPQVRHICAYWSERGTWSTDGCSLLHSNATHTLCSCDHLRSFAVLTALYPVEHLSWLLVMTKIGLIISLLCLLLSILTFKFCRSIQGTRTTIHLHLCICLFMAGLFILVGISQTKPVGGCRFVAAMLHFFFLGVFTWMLLEGVLMYRMVVFNATIRPLYLFVTGYGTPLVIVIISIIIRPNGYGTDQHCWLSLEEGLIWSFFGPVCVIIVFKIVFFIVTVWKFALKFINLNPDPSKQHKMKVFIVTAVAQMHVLGLMRVFGAFLFQEDAMVLSPALTIFNSLQGAMVFVMHCLVSKQVKEEYAHFLSCVCTLQKRHSDVSSTNPSSRQSHDSWRRQQTRESQM